MKRILNAAIYAVTGIYPGDGNIPRTVHAWIWLLACISGQAVLLLEFSCGVHSFPVLIISALLAVPASGRILGAMAAKEEWD
jgi:hypothetical protein